LKAAREKVRVARALGNLKKVDALFGRGELSYSKVRAITRVATPQSEQDFIDLALHATAAQVERLAGAYSRSVEACEASGEGEGEGEAEPPPSRRRFVRRFEMPGGMVRLEIQLPSEEAAVVWEALMAASDHGEEAGASAEAPAPCGAVDGRSGSAAGASAEAPACRGTAAGCCEAEASAEAWGPEEFEQRRADAIVNLARACLQRRPRTLGSGYELVVVTSKDQLEQGHGGVDGFLRDGTPVPLHVARMLACDSARVDVVMGEDGELLDVGRSTRSIPSAIARALWLRDGGCRVPGCGRRRHLHGHHIQPWAEGGPTRLSNLVLVCPAHHRMIHEGKLSTELRAGKITFVNRRGPLLESPPSAATGHDLEELELFLRDAELYIDPSTAAPRWDGAPMDLADTLAWMFLAEQTRPTTLAADPRQ
jgi:hypothetical protein